MPRSEKLTGKEIEDHGFIVGRVMFVSIPKNNSTRIRGAARIKPKNRVSQHIQFDGTKIAVIRDPVQRILSGLNEWRSRAGMRDLTMDFMLENFDESLPLLDEHVERQAWFIPSDGVSVFDFDRQDYLCDWLTRNGNRAWGERLRSSLRRPRAYTGPVLKKVRGIAERHFSVDLELFEDVRSTIGMLEL